MRTPEVPPIDPSDAVSPEAAVPGASPDVVVSAGFIAWLATRSLPDDRRRQVQATADRFLDWYAAAPPDHVVDLHIAIWCYLQHVREQGASIRDLQSSWAALDMFRAFTESASASAESPATTARRRTAATSPRSVERIWTSLTDG